MQIGPMCQQNSDSMLAVILLCMFIIGAIAGACFHACCCRTWQHRTLRIQPESS